MQTSMAERGERSLARSVKKNPIRTDGRNGQKIPKRFSNKTIRREEDIPNGKAYKKYYCSWNIHDYISRLDWETAKKDYEHNERWQKMYPTLKDFHRFWRRFYKNK